MGLNGTPTATRWQGAPPFGDLPREVTARSVASTRRPSLPDPRVRHQRTGDLAALLEASLARGHWRVALRRYAMLNASGQPIPSELRARCKGLAILMTRRELAQIIADALDWAAFAEMGQATGARSVTKEMK